MLRQLALSKMGNIVPGHLLDAYIWDRSIGVSRIAKAAVNVFKNTSRVSDKQTRPAMPCEASRGVD